MAEKLLIDTSAVIKYINETLPVNGLSFMDKILDNESIIPFITQIELLAWDPSDQGDLKTYEFFVSRSTVISINDLIIKETIRIRKAFKLKLSDALIAATAIIDQMTLIADNDKDFKKIPDLKYIYPTLAGNIIQ